MRINEFDFEKIQDVIEAARLLQLSGKKEDCKKILNDIANDILEST